MHCDLSFGCRILIAIVAINVLQGGRIHRFEGYAFRRIRWSDETSYWRFLTKLIQLYVGDTIRWVPNFWIIVWALFAAKLASETAFTVRPLSGNF